MKECKKCSGTLFYANGKCKACHRCNMIKHYQTNKDAIVKREAEWRKRTNYDRTPVKKFYSYKGDATRRGYSFELTKEEFVSFEGKPCDYCGDILSMIGLDRIDNSIGYSLTNVVPCCWPCNEAKGGRTREEYLLQCNKVASRYPLISK